MSEEPKGPLPDGLEIGKTILLALPSWRDLNQHILDEGPSGTLLLPVSAPAKVGETVEVHIAVADEKFLLRVRGRVSWQRTASVKGLKPGRAIDLGGVSPATRAILMDLANGAEPAIIRRKSRRFPAAIPLQMFIENKPFEAITEDLSLTGCFIRTPYGVSLEEQLRVVMRPEEEAISMRARTVWTRKGDDPGIGIEFTHMTRDDFDRLRELMRQIKSESTQIA